MTKKTTKYLEYFQTSKNKSEFIEKLLINCEGMTLKNAQRRWYDYVKIVIDHRYPIEEKQYVSAQKLLLIKDMVSYNVVLDRKYLKRYGYNDMEINWLLDNKYIKFQNEKM